MIEISLIQRLFRFQGLPNFEIKVALTAILDPPSWKKLNDSHIFQVQVYSAHLNQF